MKNEYVPIHSKLNSTPELDEFSDRQGVIEIRLKDLRNNIIIFLFDNHLAYRKLDEGDALVALTQLRATAQLGLLLYEVRNSDFIEWFVAQGYGIRAADDLRHFSIVTLNDVIDVIAFDPPRISTHELLN